MHPVNTVTTDSKQLGTSVISKIHSLVTNTPETQEKQENSTVQEPPDILTFTGSHFNAYAFS